jgi:hypothetical protein
MPRLSLGVCLLMGGCSFLFSQGPPDGHEKLRHFDCVSSEAAPAADLVGAALLGISTAAMADTPDVSTATPVSFGVWAALHAVSAVYGFATASKCDSAKQQLAARLALADVEQARQMAALQGELELQAQGCMRDEQCKGARVCHEGRCVEPPAQAPDAAPTPPAGTEGAPQDDGAELSPPVVVPPPPAPTPDAGGN